MKPLPYSFSIDSIDPISCVIEVTYYPEGRDVPQGKVEPGQLENANVKGIRVSPELFEQDLNKEELEQELQKVARRASRHAQQKWRTDLRSGKEIPEGIIGHRHHVDDPEADIPTPPSQQQDTVREV